MLRSVWGWVQGNVGTVVAGLVVVLGAGWLWDYKRKARQVEEARDQLAIQRARNDIVAFEARREMLLARADDRSAEIRTVTARIEASKARIAKLQSRAVARSPEEVSDGFRRLGY